MVCHPVQKSSSKNCRTRAPRLYRGPTGCDLRHQSLPKNGRGSSHASDRFTGGTENGLRLQQQERRPVGFDYGPSTRLMSIGSTWVLVLLSIQHSPLWSPILMQSIRKRIICVCREIALIKNRPRNGWRGRAGCWEAYTRRIRFRSSPHKPRRLVAHGPDFFFHFRDIHHDYRVPGASVEEGALWTLTEALLTSDALQGVNLDAAERWMIVIRYPKHAIFDRAILDAGRRSRAAGTAFGDHG